MRQILLFSCFIDDKAEHREMKRFLKGNTIFDPRQSGLRVHALSLFSILLVTKYFEIRILLLFLIKLI